MKQPPHSTEYEQIILGILLQWPDAIDRVPWLAAEHFYSATHRVLWQGILDAIEAGEPVDAFTVGERLQRAGTLESVGGMPYIASLLIQAPAAANLHHYAHRVRELAILREAAAVGAELSAQATEPGAKGQEVAESAIARLDALLELRQTSEAIPMSRAVADAVDWLDAPRQGLSTGYPDMDRLFTLREGDLVVIAGRPSMGKSTLAQDIAEHVAGEGHGAAIFSLEMSARQLGMRTIRWHEHRLGRSEALRYCAGLPLFVDETADLTVGRLMLKCRRLRRQHGIKIAVLDYIQLMRGDRQAENRTQEIGAISRGLKRIARELSITVLAVAQLNRAVEGRSDKRPLLSDLRESGDIEQDADVVAMVYRDEYYDEASRYKGIAECIVRKHREGPTGTVYLTFLPEFPRFESFAGSLPISEPRSPRRSVTAIDFKTRAGGDSGD